MRLDQQVAVVTGSTKGLGREMAIRFAAEGCRVVVHGMDAERAEEVRQACGPNSAVFLGDIADQPTAIALMDFAVKKFGRLDILVNNAGVVKMQPFLEFEATVWKRLLDIHLSGAFYCAQAAARVMAQAGGGRILNISSIAASFGQFGFTAYSSVKAGVEALTRVMAVELAQHKISVNCIAPGPVWNDMMEHLYGPEKLAERCRTIPMQRMAEAAEVAELALYLLSPASGYMTGQVLHLDGGASAAGCFTMEVYKRATS
ncbi:SDR family NAD(P)-dependent oxidoreductase [Paludibaculum fermentans]|uniref:SDR family oxidoreductase n=1 Tax=Paludibaculum fermentans TaxID=1473598 RepID=A0A7S7NLN2_PALFE|nr:SDR family oxidoreductase [Paludibaculum fermentans]QOY85845.1 SDR family oxidoreductase [Paludibaculum fermentans]